MYKTTLKIDGMMCGMCESHINDAIRSAFSVKKVSGSHSRGEADIISEEPIDEAKLREAINQHEYAPCHGKAGERCAQPVALGGAPYFLD